MTRDFAQRPMDFRPDILGGVAAIGDDGTFVQAIYFTSEAEEREGEQKPMPADMQKMMEQSQANTTEISFIDLISTTFASATYFSIGRVVHRPSPRSRRWVANPLVDVSLDPRHHGAMRCDRIGRVGRVREQGERQVGRSRQSEPDQPRARFGRLCVPGRGWLRIWSTVDSTDPRSSDKSVCAGAGRRPASSTPSARRGPHRQCGGFAR